MDMSKKITAWVDERKKSDNFWVEEAKMNFAIALENQLRASGLNYSSLAKKLGTSAAYITKVFRGDSNLTIESLVKLTRTTGGQLNIQISDNASNVGRWGTLPKQVWQDGETYTTIAPATVMNFNGLESANDNFHTRVAA